MKFVVTLFVVYVTAKNESMAKYAKEYPHSTLSYGAFGQDVIRAAVKQEKPFCLSISFKAPHRPVTPDLMFDDIYAGKSFTKPANYGRAAGEHLSQQSKQGRQYVRFSEWNYDTDYDGVIAKYYQRWSILFNRTIPWQEKSVKKNQGR